MKTIFLVILSLFFLGISFDSPTGFIYAVGIVVYLLRNPLRRVFSFIPHPFGFIGLGIFFGLLTEGFAILDNLKRLPENRILIDADPMRDLFFGFFFYGFFILTWYVLLKRWRFSVWQVFALSGIFGILTEQFNPAVGGPVILLQAIMNPLLGIPMALLIASVYGTFPSIAYLLTKEKFSNERRKIRYQTYCIVLVSFFVQWAIYGNIVLPFLKKILS